MKRRGVLPDLGPWRRQPLVIPPDSVRAWLRLAIWEAWMGILLCAAVVFAVRLMTTRDMRLGTLYVLLNAWCGVLMLLVALWLVWELWTAAAPKPVTDDFLKLLDDSFGCDWRKPRTWPWNRLAWAYGFTLVGVGLAFSLVLIGSTGASSPQTAKPTVVHVQTTRSFKAAP